MWFLNLLMFVSCHITDEHKRVAPCVPCPLTFIGLTCHRRTLEGSVKYQVVICLSVTCQTDAHNTTEKGIRSSIFFIFLKIDVLILKYVPWFKN
jgi:hypothetical protein